MSNKTQHRPIRRDATPSDEEARAAAAEIAATARQVAQAGRTAGDNDAQPASLDAIPMLTDVLGADKPAAPTNEPTPAPVSKPDASGKSEKPANWSEDDWNQMALQVQKNVMKSMTRRTDELINGELRDQLDEILDRGSERLLADIKNTMRQAIGEAVADAIAEEMSRARHKARETRISNQEKNV